MKTTSHKWILSLGLLAALTVAAAAGPKDQMLDIYWVDVEGGGGTPCTPMVCQPELAPESRAAI